MHDFKYLDAWTVAIDVAVAAYRLAKKFPADERFGMAKKLRRSRFPSQPISPKDRLQVARAEFKRYLMIARASAAEVESHLVVRRRVGLPDLEDVSPVADEVDRIRTLVTGPHKSL